jgi:hypothetical protein
MIKNYIAKTTRNMRKWGEKGENGYRVSFLSFEDSFSLVLFFEKENKNIFHIKFPFFIMNV